MPEIFQPEKISILSHPQITEAVIQKKIAEDPSILGLGDLILRDTERRQPHRGRLDLLLQDNDAVRRYEVEIQLGKTDESHIIRTIEYWDTERKRYPQYNHCAVIIAEEITTRFHNVINLFNGNIPFIAIQMSAYKFGDKIGLIFTTVLNELTLGIDDEEEIKEKADRNYWLNQGFKKTVTMADNLLGLINEFAGGYELNYTKFYIGLAKDGRPNNFAAFHPRRHALNLDVRLSFSKEIKEEIEKHGLDDMGYESHSGCFRLRLSEADLKDAKKKDFIKELLRQAYENTR